MTAATQISEVRDAGRLKADQDWLMAQGIRHDLEPCPAAESGSSRRALSLGLYNSHTPMFRLRLSPLVVFALCLLASSCSTGGCGFIFGVGSEPWPRRPPTRPPLRIRPRRSCGRRSSRSATASPSGSGLLETESYPSLLQNKLDEDGYAFEMVNAGVSGDTSAGGLRRLDWALDGRRARPHPGARRQRRAARSVDRRDEAEPRRPSSTARARRTSSSSSRAWKRRRTTARSTCSRSAWRFAKSRARSACC